MTARLQVHKRLHNLPLQLWQLPKQPSKMVFTTEPLASSSWARNALGKERVESIGEIYAGRPLHCEARLPTGSVQFTISAVQARSQLGPRMMQGLRCQCLPTGVLS